MIGPNGYEYKICIKLCLCYTKNEFYAKTSEFSRLKDLCFLYKILQETM